LVRPHDPIDLGQRVFTSSVGTIGDDLATSDREPPLGLVGVSATAQS